MSLADYERKSLESQIEYLRSQNERYYAEAQAARDGIHKIKQEQFTKHNDRMNKFMDYSTVAMMIFTWACIGFVLLS